MKGHVILWYDAIITPLRKQSDYTLRKIILKNPLIFKVVRQSFIFTLGSKEDLVMGRGRIKSWLYISEVWVTIQYLLKFEMLISISVNHPLSMK